MEKVIFPPSREFKTHYLNPGNIVYLYGRLVFFTEPPIEDSVTIETSMKIIKNQANGVWN